MNCDEGIVFTENNITTYLAELEEYISALVTVTAYKRDDQNAATSAIPLSQLEPKDFGKKELEVSIHGCGSSLMANNYCLSVD